MKRVFLGVVVLVGCALALPFAQTSRQVEWLYYGGDQGGMKYSPLADITPQNVNRLQPRLEVEALGNAARGVQDVRSATEIG